MSHDLIYQAFGPDANLYSTILETPQDATPSQLRKAYYKRALTFHPDKTNNDPESKLKFQAISLAYEILSDPDRRKEYDETGEFYDDDELAGGSGVNMWEEYFRGMFKRVSLEDIDKFESEYKRSEEEKKDVLKYYKMCKGNLDEMLTCVMLSEEKDKKRWLDDYIMPAIQNKEVKHYKDALEKSLDNNDKEDDETVTDDDEDNDKRTPKHVKQSKAKRKAQAKKEKEAKEAEDLLAKLRGNALARREKAFDSMMSGIEARYSNSNGAGDKKRKGSKKRIADDPPDIPDEEFDKIQNSLESNRKSRSSSTRKKKK